jgi:hypothetical protein
MDRSGSLPSAGSRRICCSDPDVGTGDDARVAEGDGGPSLSWLARGGEPLRTLAEIWATVELERAQTELDHGALAAGPVGEVHDDPLLGARVVIVSAGEGGVPIAIAEPSTEGRLAATLVRHGEGRAGRYVRSPVALDTVRALAADAGMTVSRPASGPFGSAVLVLTGSVAGPHLILVEPATTEPDPLTRAHDR